MDNLLTIHWDSSRGVKFFREDGTEVTELNHSLRSIDVHQDVDTQGFARCNIEFYVKLGPPPPTIPVAEPGRRKIRIGSEMFDVTETESVEHAGR